MFPLEPEWIVVTGAASHVTEDSGSLSLSRFSLAPNSHHIIVHNGACLFVVAIGSALLPPYPFILPKFFSLLILLLRILSLYDNLVSPAALPFVLCNIRSLTVMRIGLGVRNSGYKVIHIWLLCVLGHELGVVLIEAPAHRLAV